MSWTKEFFEYLTLKIFVNHVTPPCFSRLLRYKSLWSDYFLEFIKLTVFKTSIISNGVFDFNLNVTVAYLL